MWDKQELTKVFPVHDGPVIDIAVDCRCLKSSTDSSYHVVTASSDRSVLLSRISSGSLFRERSLKLPHAIMSISNFYGTQKNCGLDFLGHRSKIKEDPYRLPRVESLLIDTNEDVSTRSVGDIFAAIFVVGTAENSIYAVDFETEKFHQIMSCHQEGRTLCMARGKTSNYDFVSVGEDGKIKIWDAHQKSLSQQLEIDICHAGERGVDRSKVLCADVSSDGNTLILGLNSNQIMLFDLVLRKLVDFVVQEEEAEIREVLSMPNQMVISLSMQSSSIIGRLSTRAALVKADEEKRNLSRKQTVVSNSKSLESISSEIDKIEREIREKIENRLKGLSLIPVEMYLINRIQATIESFCDVQKIRSLDTSEVAEVTRCKGQLESLMASSRRISNAVYDIDTGCCHIELEHPVGSAGRDQIITIQKTSNRIPSLVGKFTLVKISPDQKFVAVCGEGGIEIRSFSRLQERLCKVKCYEGVVTHLDWSRDSRVFQLNTSRSVLQFWSLKKVGSKWENELMHPKTAANIDWATWTCSMGWPVNGIVGRGSDRRSLIVSANEPKQAIAVGDDQGVISVHAFPCRNFVQGRKACNAHAAPLSSLFFLGTGNILISSSAGVS